MGSEADRGAVFIRHVTYPLWIWKNRSSLLKILRELEESQYLSPEAAEELQWGRFKAMIRYAFENCPYYRKRYEAAGVRPEDIRDRRDLLGIPVLNKAEIQAWAPQMISKRFAPGELLRDMTGGSTGSPLIFYYDRSRRDSRNAATIRHNRWAGWEIGNKVALLWGAARDVDGQKGRKERLKNVLLNRSLLLDASSIDRERMASFAAGLIRFQPKVLLGYANTLAFFARYLRENGKQLIGPESVVSSAECLTPENRRLLEETFGCPVYDRYGCREFAVVASECEFHAMHINAENLLVEVVGENGSARMDKPGEILITDLQNFAMPMIRYRIQDMGSLRKGVCRCGRGLPLLEMAAGRVTDFLEAEDGCKVSGVAIATYVITNIPGIGQIQFVQEKRKEVTLRIVRNSAWTSATLAALKKKTLEFLGREMQMHFDFPESIPPEPSGKFRFSKNTLSDL